MALPEPASGSIALVTGASSGIGEHLARQLAQRGHAVGLVARRVERLEALAAELGAGAHVLPCDLADAAARDDLAARVDALGKDVSILVNNAGFGTYGPFIEQPRERELEQVRVLVEAVVDLTHRYLPGMVDRGRGAVINVTSTSGFTPSPYNAGYAAAKSHVLFFSEALRAEVKERGVSVTAVCPGPVATGFQEESDAHFFEDRMPKLVWVPVERVARDVLDAADRNKRVVIPGGVKTRIAFGANRYAPVPIALGVAKRLLKT